MKKKTKLFAPKEYGFQPCSYHQATEPMKKDAAGGCGPGGSGDKYVPDTIYGLTVTPSCAVHDWMYHYGETPEDKKRADTVFLNNMIRQIESGSGFKVIKFLRKKRARTYYNFVVWFGGPSFYKNVNTEEELA